MNRVDRHVALKVLSAHASREVEAGRLKEREILRKITNASPLHHGFNHVIHLLHEFAFESFAGQHICFVTDVLSYSVASLQKELNDPRLPLRMILRLTKHVLKGLEYLHDECEVIHSGMFNTSLAVDMGQSNYLTDLKPGNILILPSDLDNIVMHELSERPALLFGFPSEMPPHELLFQPVQSAPLIFALSKRKDKDNGLNWVIADLGHGALTRC
jgi:serine/threonine-protein kinase SRPK3